MKKYIIGDFYNSINNPDYVPQEGDNRIEIQEEADVVNKTLHCWAQDEEWEQYAEELTREIEERGERLTLLSRIEREYYD